MVGDPTISKNHGQLDASPKSIELFLREMQSRFDLSLPKLLLTIGEKEAG